MENFQRRTQNKKITLHQYRTVQQNIWKLPKKEKETKRRLKGRCDMGKRKSFFLANLSVPHFERISSLKLKWQDFWRFDNMLQEINCGCDSQLSIRFTEQKKKRIAFDISHHRLWAEYTPNSLFKQSQKGNRSWNKTSCSFDRKKKKFFILLPLFQIGGRNWTNICHTGVKLANRKWTRH